MRYLVTGAAGFIGSHLAERLIADGHEVIGLDAFVSYYPRAVKEHNLTRRRQAAGFSFWELDLRHVVPAAVLDGVDVVMHLAAMPGLTASWTDFAGYLSCNLTATQHLLEACRDQHLRRFVHVSTSSVYGRDAIGDESAELRPISPYGVTKLAAERLVLAYTSELDVPGVVLRYFSVYGPRQRPDMGYHQFIARLLRDEPITIFGDGEQTRGNTYVADCVAATVLAATAGRPGPVYNIGGGEARSVHWVIQTLGEIIGREPRLRYGPRRTGDQQHTRADISRAQRDLAFHPRTRLRDGLAAQVAWQRTQQKTSCPMLVTRAAG